MNEKSSRAAAKTVQNTHRTDVVYRAMIVDTQTICGVLLLFVAVQIVDCKPLVDKTEVVESINESTDDSYHFK